MKKEVIKNYYYNAKELVKLNRPKEARDYVLAILNSTLEYYHLLNSTLEKKKTEKFLIKWIKVSKDLYDLGITDYVLESFGLTKNINNNDFIIDDVPNQGWCAVLFEKYKNAVVRISVSNDGKTIDGTGFFIADGYLLTNNHIVYNQNKDMYYDNISIYFDDKKYNVYLVAYDNENDLALFRFDSNICSSHEIINLIDDYNKIKPGADCLVIGNPFNLGLAPFTGIVKYTLDKNNNLIYQAPSNFGDSGGPLFNRNGECIGINKSKMVSINNTKVDGFALATPSTIIKQKLKEWIK